MNKKENFFKGFIKENPIFVFLLGMCPALAVTGTFETSLGMGLLVIFVLTMSNIVVSLIKGFIPDELRTPSYIVVIATFVTVVKMLSEAYAVELYDALGVFIPLIVVNCLILGRAEAFASKNNVVDSMIDGLGMGLGFTFGLVLIGLFREFFATGAIVYGEYLKFGVDAPIEIFNLDWLIPVKDFFISDYTLGMFSLPPGAFIALGVILAIMQYKKHVKTQKEIAEKKRIIEEKKKAALAKKAAAAAAKKAGASA